jgi:small-conductance mechanosensitive channel
MIAFGRKSEETAALVTALVAAKDETIRALETRIRELERLNTEARQQLAERPVLTAVPEPAVVAHLPSRTQSAIAAESAGNTALQRHLTREALRLHALGQPDAEIAQRILRGDRVTD